VKKIAGVKESVSKVDDNNITSMVDEMRKEHV
jgi:hypothetical protein